MVRKRHYILLLALLLLLSLMSLGSWLLATRAGALWLFGQAGGAASLRISLSDLRGSLLAGLELQELSIDWPGGHLSADHLQIDWQPQALLQRRLQIDYLSANALALRLAAPAQKAERVAADADATLIPDISAWLRSLGDWSLGLQQLQVESLRLSGSAGQLTRLQQIGAKAECSAAQLSLSALELDGDWGRWRGSLQWAAAAPLLSGQLSWKPPHPLGPIETLEAQLSLLRTQDGRLSGPVAFKGQGKKFRSYRLSGDLRLDLAGLELASLQLDHGSESDGTAQGELRLGWQGQFSWQTELDLTDLNLVAELGRVTKISGKLRLKGQKNRYSGHLNLRNERSGWEHLSLSGALEGDAEQLAVTRLQGSLLGGKVQGEVGVNWRTGVASLFKLKGEDLHLSQLAGGPAGSVDLRVDGWLKKTAGSELQLGGAAQITRAMLLGRDFSGELRGNWRGGRQLKIDSLDLHGAWGQFKARGDLQKHLSINLELDDAAALWPALEGDGVLTGWLAWHDAWPHGELNGRLHNLAYQNWQAAELVLDGKQAAAAAEADLQLQVTDLQKADGEPTDLELNIQGLPSNHRLQLQIDQHGGQVSAELQGALQKDAWRARVTAVELSALEIESYRLTKPFEISFDPAQLSFSEILLQGNLGGNLSLAGHWNRRDKVRRAEASWEELNLSWLKLWLAGMQFDGESSGQGSFDQNQKGEMRFDLQADYVGAFAYAGQKLELENAQIAGRWDRQGLVIDAELRERSGGKLNVVAGSVSEAGFYVPQSGNLHLELKGLPLALFNMEMPPGQELRGLLAADLSGRWLNDGQFSLAGKAGVEQGAFSYQDGQSRLEIPFEKAELSIDWQQAGLLAKMNLGLGAGDGVAGNVKLQLPAHWPLDLVRPQAISGELQFHLGKLGALSLLVPEQLADFSGEIGGALRLAGSLQEPDFAGDLRLRGGRLSLQQLGVVLDQIGLEAVFNAQQLRIEQLTLKAGEGELQGRGEVLFDGWKPERFTVELKGDNALIANLPELRAVASPDLRMVGNAEGLTLGGVLKIPELQILNWHPPGRIVKSEDVIYIDQLPKPAPPKSLEFKLDLDVELGERVVVKDRGLDVRLGGDFHLSKDIHAGVLARGQIDIPAGHYSTYGVKLPITTGQLYFSGGPADNPALDIIAQKKVGEVSAGVAVGGTVRQPVIRLISDPALDDTDILSYIVLGRPTLGGSGDFSVLSLAASALLSAGDSASFQQKLKNRSGIDVIDVNTGGEAGLETAVVTVGKYLTPELYLSYGRALSTSVSQLQLRYSPSPRVDIESQLGEVSGADLYYRIEFN